MRRLAFIDALARPTRKALISARRATRVPALQVQRGNPLVSVNRWAEMKAGDKLVLCWLDQVGLR